MKDYVIKATSGNGEIRAYVGNTREMVEQARVNHNTTKVAKALGISQSSVSVKLKKYTEENSNKT